MGVEIIDAASNPGRWDSLVSRLPSIADDIYFYSGYVGLPTSENGSTALMFAFQRDPHFWLYPLLLQPVTSLGKLTGFFDIDSAYGYGGPLSTTDDELFLADAHLAFTDWCRSQGVVAEFVRLHPLIENQRWLDPQTTVLFDRETVSLDLSRLEADQIPYDAATCYMLRRASRLDCTIGVRKAEENFEQFVRLYIETMKGLGAEDYYYFNSAYFLGLQRLVQHRGWLVIAETAGEWVAASLFLRGANWLHYHLAAARPGRRLPGVANLLIHTAAQMGHKSGLSLLHLGGGRTASPQDSLLKFKATMAPNRHHFHIGKRIHQPGVHRELCDAWRNAYPELVPLHGHRLLCYHYSPVPGADATLWGMGK